MEVAADLTASRSARLSVGDRCGYCNNEGIRWYNLINNCQIAGVQGPVRPALSTPAHKYAVHPFPVSQRSAGLISIPVTLTPWVASVEAMGRPI